MTLSHPLHCPDVSLPDRSKGIVRAGWRAGLLGRGDSKQDAALGLGLEGRREKLVQCGSQTAGLCRGQ